MTRQTTCSQWPGPDLRRLGPSLAGVGAPLRHPLPGALPAVALIARPAAEAPGPSQAPGAPIRTLARGGIPAPAP